MSVHIFPLVHLWAVLTTKSSGANVVFNTYAERIEAQRVVEQLRQVGCLARVELAREADEPGRERRHGQ